MSSTNTHASGATTDPDLLPSSLRAIIVTDLRAMASLKGTELSGFTSWLDMLTLPGSWATMMARTANHMHAKGIKPLSRFLYFMNIVLFSCEIQPGATIGPGFVMPHPTGVAIGSGVRIGARAHVMGLTRVGGGGTDDPTKDGFPTIGDDVWMLDGAKILGAITVGDRIVVASASTVLHSFPDGDCILVGTPARIGKSRLTAEPT